MENLKDNPAVQQALANLINATSENLKGAGDVTGDLTRSAAHGLGKAAVIVGDQAVKGAQAAAEQIPDILHQYVIWGLCYNGFFVALSLIGLLLFCGTLYGAYRYVRSWKSDLSDHPEVIFFLFPLAGFGIPSIIGLCTYGPTLLQIALAPKVWLIQQAVAMFKS